MELTKALIIENQNFLKRNKDEIFDIKILSKVLGLHVSKVSDIICSYTIIDDVVMDYSFSLKYSAKVCHTDKYASDYTISLTCLEEKITNYLFSKGFVPRIYRNLNNLVYCSLYKKEDCFDSYQGQTRIDSLLFIIKRHGI